MTSETREIARYACGAYSWLLIPNKRYTGEEFAEEIKNHFAASHRTNVIIKSVKECVERIMLTEWHTEYKIRYE